MSLFRTKTFWSNQCSDDEEYDQSSLKVSRLNSDSDFIFVGSHSGFLRIYRPSGPVFGQNATYKPNDLYLETNLGDAILQIGIGKFVSGSQIKQVAILQPRCIGIYTLLTKDGIAEHGTENILNLVYEHKLRRSAANFASGPFGGAHNRDFLCVQSLDGMLTFFEQETFTFCCFLPEFLLPAPLAYARSSDIFITLSSSWYLKTYKYKTLSESGSGLNQEDASSGKIDTFWEYNLGEGVLDIQTLYDDITRQNYIAVLGEKNLFYFSDHGRLIFMKKLDFLPQCFLLYNLDDGKSMFLVLAETNTLLLYQGSTLKWSAKLEFLPIAIARAFFSEISGALVMLSEDGYLQLAYLGTEPNLFSAPPLKNQDIDFEKVDNELATLNKIIKSNQMTDVSLSNIKAEREITVSITVSPHLENRVDEMIAEGQMCCKVTVEIVPNAIFEEVHLSVSVQKPLTVNPASKLYTNLCETISFICFVYPNKNFVIPSLELEATISFVTSLGTPRVSHKKAVVPLRLVYETCPPSKDGQHKITLNLNQNSVPLSELFPEFIGENSLSLSSSAIGLKHISSNSPVVTVIIAKSSQKYRLQCDNILCLNLLIREIVRRLKGYYVNHSNFAITSSSQLPMSECVGYMKTHFQAVQNVTRFENDLNLLSSQYRLIQKRLIAKFKQKNPTPLSNLDILLKNTYEDILNVIGNLEEEKEKLMYCQIELQCALNLVTNLLDLIVDNGKNIEMVKAILMAGIYDYENQHWEDVTDASLCFLLRTSLAKSEKDKLRAPHTSFEEVKDILKLEKHFVQVLERATKKSVVENTDNQEVLDIEPVNIEDTPVAKEEPSDIGTEFATASTRALSARQSLLKRRHKVE